MGHPDSLSIKCLFPQKFSHVSPSSSNFESKFLWESWHLSSILEPRIQGHESCIPHLEHVWTTSQNPEQRWCGGDRKRVEQWNAGHPQGLLFTPPPVGLFSTGLATIGTGRAVGSVGASAIGAVSEDSTILGRTLIFVGMAEGIAIYGMIISILILFI